MSSANTTTNATDVIKGYQALYDRVSAAKYKPKIKDRKELSDLYSKYTSVSQNDETLLEDLTTLQDLLQKCQNVIR